MYAQPLKNLNVFISATVFTQGLPRTHPTDLLLSTSTTDIPIQVRITSRMSLNESKEALGFFVLFFFFLGWIGEGKRV